LPIVAGDSFKPIVRQLVATVEKVGEILCDSMASTSMVGVAVEYYYRGFWS
jgi:hypothetical protein